MPIEDRNDERAGRKTRTDETRGLHTCLVTTDTRHATNRLECRSTVARRVQTLRTLFLPFSSILPRAGTASAATGDVASIQRELKHRG